MNKNHLNLNIKVKIPVKNEYIYIEVKNGKVSVKQPTGFQTSFTE